MCKANRLLAALPDESREQVMPKLTRVALSSGDVLLRANTPLDSVLFPISGMVCTITKLNAAAAELGLVGREGMVGVSAVHGNSLALFDYMVQGDGYGLRMQVTDLREQLNDNLPLRRLLLRYCEARFLQAGHLAACNGWHDLPSRLARWLLMAYDRCDDGRLPITHQFLAMMLCVHRPRITVATTSLRTAGIIDTERGYIVVRDRGALAARACECYAVMQEKYERLFASA